MNGVYFYFVNKLFLVGRYWDFNYRFTIVQNEKHDKQFTPNSCRCLFLILIFQFTVHSYVYVVYLEPLIFNTVHHPYSCYTVLFSYSRMIYETFWEIHGRLLQVCVQINNDFGSCWSQTLGGLLIASSYKSKFRRGNLL